MGKTATWTTQRIIAGGRIIDLCMDVDGVPLIVVENKIGAGFQEHKCDTQHAGALAKQNQLATYGRWLAKVTHQDWGGALVLLTHWTPAPADFEHRAKAYASRYLNTIRWAGLSRWLARLAEGSTQPEVDWVRLSGEMVAFLKEQNMDSELATGHDLAALRIYIASADRVRNSVERIWHGAESVWRPICQQTNSPLEVSTAYGCVWKYRYLARSDLRKSYLAVGIRYPDVGTYPAGFSRDGAPYFFVELCSDNASSGIKNLAMPKCWKDSDGIRLAACSLRDLPADADLLVAKAEEWVKARIMEVASALG